MKKKKKMKARLDICRSSVLTFLVTRMCLLVLVVTSGLNVGLSERDPLVGENIALLGMLFAAVALWAGPLPKYRLGLSIRVSDCIDPK
jgi:hypothetical protein